MGVREHICGFHELNVTCVDSVSYVDHETGHTVCSGCERITLASGLRVCDICESEYIDKTKYQDPRKADTNCPRCVEEYGLEE
jgi:hypothetical protein